MARTNRALIWLLVAQKSRKISHLVSCQPRLADRVTESTSLARAGEAAAPPIEGAVVVCEARHF